MCFIKNKAYFCVFKTFYYALLLYSITFLYKGFRTYCYAQGVTSPEQELYAPHVNVLLDQGYGQGEEDVYVPLYLNIQLVKGPYPDIAISFLTNNRNRVPLTQDELNKATLLSELYYAKKDGNDLELPVKKESDLADLDDEIFYSWEEGDFVVCKKTQEKERKSFCCINR